MKTMTFYKKDGTVEEYQAINAIITSDGYLIYLEDGSTKTIVPSYVSRIQVKEQENTNAQ